MLISSMLMCTLCVRVCVLCTVRAQFSLQAEKWRLNEQVFFTRCFAARRTSRSIPIALAETLACHYNRQLRYVKHHPS